MAEKSSGSCDPYAETRIGPPDTERAAASIEIGKIRYFGAYELLEEIARGGMGVVYKARQSTLKRIVAVKVILSGQLASEEEIRRFLIEAEASANLSHPGIVPVYEFGEHEGLHYFSMAYVDGPSLADRVADRPLSPEDAVPLMRAIAEAVAYAHSQGVVHRDLKPSNILLEGGITPRIADFGLAKRIKDDNELTRTGTVMGSVYYMAPEQAAGKTEEVGPPADIYALGAMLYRLLAGRPPFQAATGFETMQQVIHDEPVPPRQLNPAIPRDLETICLKCLEKDPARRYASAEDLLAEFARVQNGLPILARPIGRLDRTWRWYRRNPVPATLGAALILALLVGLVTGVTLWNRARAEHQRAQDQQRMVGVLSAMVLEKTLDETQEWLRLFFEPVEQQLAVARAWGAAGLLNKDDPDALNRLLAPLIAHYPQISSLLIADSRGREHMLLSMDPRGGGDRAWRNRITRRDQSPDRVRWVEWTDADPTARSEEVSMPDYDPRARPWYQGAIARRDEGGADAHWTAPYVFFTTKDLGITASTTFDPGDGFDHVVAFDVLLEDITAYTTGKAPTENGIVLVLTPGGELVGLPRAPSLPDPDAWKRAFLKTPANAGLDTAARALDAFGDGRPDTIRHINTGAGSWWAARRTFRLGTEQQLWILVLVPERDLQEDLAG